MKIEQEKGRRSIPLGVRATPEVAALLGKLAEVISGSLAGARVSKSQALEIAIREALAARGGLERG